MNKETVFAKVKETVAEVTRCENPNCLKPESRLQDLAFDSLDWIQVQIQIEEDLELKEIDNDKFADCNTLGDFVDLVLATGKREDDDGTDEGRTGESPKAAETTEAPETVG